MADPIYIVIPKDLPTWEYEAFRKLLAKTEQAGSAIDAIGRGENPDGSGTPLLDLSKFFYLPGRTGGQISYQSDARYPTLTMTQPSILSGAAELLRFYTAGKMVKFKPDTFSVTCTTNGTTTLAATGIGVSFTPTGGPRVTEGMLITGTNIPAGTYVRSVTSSVTILMTQAASGSGATTVTFEPSVDIGVITDETGKDIEWRAYGGVRFTPGTEGIPLRIVGDYTSIASGVAATGRIYLEAGYTASGSAVGTELQIGGPNRGELAHMNIFARTLWLSRSPASGTDITVGFGEENPATYGGGNGPAAVAIFGANARPVTITGPSSGGFLLTMRGPSTGTSPNKVLGNTFFRFEHDSGAGLLKFYLDNGIGGGCYMAGVSDGWELFQQSNSLQQLASGRVSAWSDSLAVASSFFFQIGDVSSSHRAVFVSSAGNAIFTRFGIGSSYILLTDAQAGSADFLAPSAGSPLLRVFNSVTAADVIMEIRGATSQSGNMLEFRTVSGTLLSFVDSLGAWNGPITTAGTKRTILLMAAGGKGTTTAGCGGPTQVEATTNKNNYWALEYDTTTEENAFWNVQMPDSYDGGTITARFIWTNAAGLTTETVRFGIKARAYGDGIVIDQTFGTEVVVDDTWIAQNDVHISAATSAITIAGSPAGGQWIIFNVARKVASDNLTGDARLLAVQIEYGINSYGD